jgi:hypothetical protein
MKNLHSKKYKTIAIPVWDNRTFEREIEDKLTNALKRANWQQTHFRLLNPMTAWDEENKEPDTFLEGNIAKISRFVPLEGRFSTTPLMRSVSVTVDFTWRDKKSVIKKFQLTASGQSFGARGESDEDALIEALDKVARDLLANLEEGF